jgi:fructose-1,6-bisphosphate aldolase class II
MPLVTLKSVLTDAQKGSYAVGAFNFNGIEDARGILDAAAEKKSPVILMTSVSAVDYMGGPRAVTGLIHGLADCLDIPVVLHLDHAEKYDLICQCVDAGYTSVMVDASKLSFEENIAATQQVVSYARKYGVSVEAELGRLGGREEQVNVSSREAAMTDPADVPGFVSATGIDALAVAIGTAHGFYKEEPKLDFDRLTKIRSLTDTPLVLHGGTGVPEEDFIRSIRCGMAKINVGTELKYCCSQTVRKSVADQPDQIDIRKLVGPARANCRDIVLHKIDLFGSAGKA